MLVFILIISIALLIIIPLILYNNHKLQRNQFNKKETDLRKTIVKTLKKQDALNDQIQLTEEFYANYQKSKKKLVESIHDAQIELLNNQFKKKKT